MTIPFVCCQREKSKRRGGFQEIYRSFSSENRLFCASCEQYSYCALDSPCERSGGSLAKRGKHFTDSRKFNVDKGIDSDVLITPSDDIIEAMKPSRPSKKLVTVGMLCSAESS